MCVCILSVDGKGDGRGKCGVLSHRATPDRAAPLPLSPYRSIACAAGPRGCLPYLILSIRVMYIRVMYGPVTDLWALRTFVISDSACIDPGLAERWQACGLGAWTDAAQSDGARGHRAHPATGSGGAGQLGRRLPARPACRDRARVGAGFRQSQQCHQQRREWWRRRCVRRCRS